MKTGESTVGGVISKRTLFEISLLFLGSAQKDLPKQAQSRLVSALNLPRVFSPANPSLNLS
jgi:hypothetical protein